MKNMNLIFAICLLLWEIGVAFIYGYSLGINPQADPTIRAFSVSFVPFLLLLLLVGFSLLTSYAAHSGFIYMAHNLLLFALTLQNQLIFRQFWDRTNIQGVSQPPNFTRQRLNKITLLPILNDPFNNSISIGSYALTDAISCAVSMYVISSSLLGRFHILSILVLSILGPLFWQGNNLLFYRLKILDMGFGMRVFFFGGLSGLLIGSLLARWRAHIEDQNNLKTSYESKSYALLGSVLIWCCFPLFCLNQLTTISNSSEQRIGITMINLILALCASVCGVFTASTLDGSKLEIRNLVFSSISGGIAFSSASNINYNSGVAIAIGFLGGLIMSLLQNILSNRINQSSIMESNPSLVSYLLPGLIAGILSATFSVQVETNIGRIIWVNQVPGRTKFDQGASQVVGLGLTLIFSLFLGLIIVAVIKLFDQRENKQLFSKNLECSLGVKTE